MSAKYRHAFKSVVFCIEPERPLGWNFTIHTSTTLLSGSYLAIHLREYLDSRRTSRASSTRPSADLQRTTSFNRQSRSHSLSTSTNLLPCHAKTNLSRQISFSDSGDKICPSNSKSGLLSPPIALGQTSLQTKVVSSISSFPTLVEEKEESSV